MNAHAGSETHRTRESRSLVVAPLRYEAGTAFPMLAVVVGIVLTLSLIVVGISFARSVHEDSIQVVDTQMKSRQLSADIMYLDEVLTMSARMAAATGDSRWSERYDTHKTRLDAALTELATIALDVQLNHAASQTDHANGELVRMETEALMLVSRGRNKEASAILCCKEYDENKTTYANGTRDFLTTLQTKLEGTIQRQEGRIVAIGVIGIVVVGGLAGCWLWIVMLIKKSLRARDAAHADLHQLARDLETHVSERTDSLREANASLKREMHARALMEMQIRLTQKLESVGRLASGIAHEINTPMQFVNDSVSFVKSAMPSIARVVGQYADLTDLVLAGGASPECASKACKVARDADLPYLLKNVPEALSRSLEGIERVASIVRSLKEFARPEETEMSAEDLNHAISNTLTIARHEYSRVADVETDFGECPPVTCHVGELNEAVLDIIVNAAQSIADVVKETDRRGRIAVCTRRDGDDVVIAISDTGIGIPEEAREHVFEPFFTTKEVGSGMGQSLAIAYSCIVDRHGGKLSFESETGKGTTFYIRLPIQRRLAECLQPQVVAP